MVVALNVLANVARMPSNFILQMLKLLLNAILRDPEDKILLNGLPTDIRTVRKWFKLNPSTTTYASCPTCYANYAPTRNPGSDVDVYPARCSTKRYPGSKPCKTRLTKWGIKGGESVRVPIKPYQMQNFRDFVGRMYCRRGIEEAIAHWKNFVDDGGDVRDINQGDCIRNLRGHDGKRFLDDDNEIRTVWSLSYDGFNPLHNKAAGKSASAGSLAMLCLSLPPSIRYRSENIFLAGIVPGPRQPTLDGLNAFLSPLVDTLDECYRQGTWYSRTIQYPEGRRSREAVVPIVADLPGSRKLSGCAGHSAMRFCSLCHLTKRDINNLDISSPAWRRVTYEEHLEAAKAWRDAPNKLQRARLYKRNGVRWSELLRLPYWDPTHHVVIDGMHNLYLGLVRHHFRAIVGTEWKDPMVDEDIQEKQSSGKAVAKGRRILNNNPTKASLQHLPITVLRALCAEYKILDRLAMDGKHMKKKYLIEALQVSNIVNESIGLNEPIIQLYVHPGPDVSIANREHETSTLDGGWDIIATDLGSPDEIPNIYKPLLLTRDLHQIQSDIASTTRPTWRTNPPKNFGSPSHGKLKADEWRACIEFDLPVSLVKLWMQNKVDPAADKSMRNVHAMTVESTMYLAMAIRWVTSHRTSAKHAERYLHYMMLYLHSIRALRPGMDLHPIHHNALHLPDFLPAFGPLHGWWMFVFERLNGTLQKINTNFHAGELEILHMKSWVEHINFKQASLKKQC